MAVATDRALRRVAGTDWIALAAELDGHGCAPTAQLLTPAECHDPAALYEKPEPFRTTAGMARHRFESGEYRYFTHDLPAAVAALRAARATGLRNLPRHRTAQNRIRLEIVQIALDLLAWIPMLALTGKARLWEPRRLRLRLFTAAGQIMTTGRRQILRLARHWPWTGHITTALDRLTHLPDPG